MYRIRQTRTLRGSAVNGLSQIIWTGGRIKEARGQCKAQLNSTMEMLLNHEFEYTEGDIDYVNYELTLADDDGVWYRMKYDIEEYTEET